MTELRCSGIKMFEVSYAHRRTMKRPWIDCNLLLEAIDKRDVDNAEQIIDAGFDVDSVIYDGKSAISICIERGVSEIANLLLKRGCSLSLKSPRGECPLHLAVKRGDINMVETLLESRADITSIDSLGRTALHLACWCNNSEIVKALMARASPSLVTLKDIDERTALIYACKYANQDVVELLLPKSDVNVCDRYEDSPLLSCLNNHLASPSVISMLLDSGAFVNQMNSDGETPLLKALRMLCILRGHDSANFLQIAVLLVDHGSDLLVKNCLGQTPLHLAVSANNETLVRKLLNAKCDANAKDNMSCVPLFYACRNCNRRIVDILIKGGANVLAQEWELTIFKRSVSVSQLLEYVLDLPKQTQPLTSLCRTVVRKSLKNIERDSELLPVPFSVAKFIKLDDA